LRLHPCRNVVTISHPLGIVHAANFIFKNRQYGCESTVEFPVGFDRCFSRISKELASTQSPLS
jgi:hypothetical protein